MISAFGIISFVVLVASLVLLVWHTRLMRRRGGVDMALENVYDALESAPEELAAAVGAYNDAVNDYNEYIGTPPGKVSAAFVGLKKEQLMELPE